ncbi:MAG: cation-transporting P-type ATPase [Desulfurococcaceae archaeon]
MPGDHGVIGEMPVENYYWHSMSVEEVVNVLSTNLQSGLSSSEAERRLRVYGLNEIPVKKKSPLVMFARQFANFLIGILLVATAVSAFLGEIVDALAIFAVVLLMGVFGFIQEYRSEKTLEALKRLATPKCRVLRDGVEQEIEASKLVPGDVVLLREGDRVPADLRIVEADNLEVDESPLTGESVPVAKQPALVHEESTPLSDRRNMAYLGTYVVRGRGKGVVVATGLNTELGKIAKAVAEVKEEKTPLEVELDYFGKRIGAIILGISAIVFATSLYVSREGFIQALMIAIALAVAAVPEGLPAIATAVLAIGAYRMARKNAIVKRLAAVEALGSVDIICADKTGTITKGEMTVKVIKLLDNECSVEGVGFEPKGEIKCRENTGLESLYEMIAAHTWTDAKLVREPNGWVIKGSPTEGAALVLAYKALGEEGVIKAVEELKLVKIYPFDRFRKRKSTVHVYNGKYLVVVSGAPEVVLSLSTRIVKSSNVAELSEDERNRVLKFIEELASSGYRTFALAFRILENYDQDSPVEEVEKDLVFYAVLGIIDPPREGVREAVELAKRAGVKTVMVTGDHKLTAIAVARMIGIDVDNGLVLEGKDLDTMSDEELLRVVDKVAVYARVTPQHKMRIVKLLKQKGYRVAMTGDGVNDAPALKEAHVGVAMGIRGTDVAKEASQLVLMDDNYVTIVEAIKEGRVIFENLKKPINYLLTCNMAEVASVFGAQLIGKPAPFEPIHLLWINVVTDAMPATALGVEPPEPGIMDRPPRRPEERFITRRKLAYYLAMGSLLALVTLWNYLLYADVHLELARTAAFTAIVVSELGRALSSRSENTVFWRLKPNKWLIPALVASLGLHMVVLYTPLRFVFHTVPLDIAAWMPVILAPLVVLVADEVRKLIGIRI